MTDSETLNVEIEIDNEMGPREVNVFQRVAEVFGFGGAQDLPEQQDELIGEEQFDLFDFAYAVFRVSILMAICITYASWQRLALVVAVGMFFYWLVNILKVYVFVCLLFNYLGVDHAYMMYGKFSSNKCGFSLNFGLFPSCFLSGVMARVRMRSEGDKFKTVLLFHHLLHHHRRPRRR